MNKNHGIRALHFAANPMAWAALRHFLPASLLRELCQALVTAVDPDGPGFGSLFEEAGLPADGPISIWAMRGAPTDSPLGSYLQQRVQAFAWGDSRVVGLKDDSSPAFEAARVLEFATAVGEMDFGSFRQPRHPIRERALSTLHAGIGDLKAASGVGEAEDVATRIVAEISMPLATVMLKHLGDLCADQDRWEEALLLYRRAGTAMQVPDVAWGDLVASMKAIVQQSEASALRTVEGVAGAADLLDAALAGKTFGEAPLLILNATGDAVNASFLRPGTVGPRRSATVVAAPQVLFLQDLTAAFERWTSRDYHEAQVSFWATLRRQLALGSSTASRNTKSLYATCLIDQLRSQLESDSAPAAFAMALGLLIESGDAAAAARIEWGEALVRSYVDASCLDLASAHADRHAGSRTERRTVLVALFESWVRAMAPDRLDLASRMLSRVAAFASEHEAVILTRLDVGGRSLKVLQSIARERPEFRTSVATPVAHAIVGKVSQSGFWRGRSDALKTAELFLDVFGEADLARVLDAVLTSLDGLDPGDGAWPIVQPALGLLASPEAKRRSERDPVMGRKIIDAILRFGLGSRSEQTRLLIYLRHFDPHLLVDEEVSGKIRAVIPDVRKRALAIDSSDVCDNIRALLAVPALADREGVDDALSGLSSILDSALSPHPSIAFASANQVFLMLAERWEAIVRDLGPSAPMFLSRMEPLEKLLRRVWGEGARTPVIFAPFSLPIPTKPNATTVHNWVYASIAFATKLGDSAAMLEAIDAAALNPLLADAIALARATRLAVGDGFRFDEDAIGREDRETFYAALGARLVGLKKADAPPLVQTVTVLLKRCLDLGPRGLDAGVFAIAMDLGLGISGVSSDYIKRLDNKSDLRLALMPLLRALGG